LKFPWAILGASFGPIVVLGLCWRRVGSVAAVVCMIAGASTAIIWGSIPALHGNLKNYFVAPIIALILTVLATLIFPAGRPYRGPVGAAGNANPPTLS
jgi:sodium/proline symporter